MSSAISGDPRRGTGILNNEKYIGRVVWRRTQWLASASDSKKHTVKTSAPNEVIRWNDESLRIIPQALWDKVKARQREQSARLAQAEQQHAALLSASQTPDERRVLAVIPRLAERIARMVREFEHAAVERSPLDIARARSDLHAHLGDIRIEAEGNGRRKRPVAVVQGVELALMRAAGGVPAATDNFGSGGQLRSNFEALVKVA